MKILIIDDNEPYRKLLCAIFQEKGWETLDAPEGSRGLEFVKEHIPDVILSDIMMPRMDGFQVLRALRTSAFRDIIFIFYTATYTKSNHRDFALSLGADAYIAKPLDPEDIVHVLMDILDGKELRPTRREQPSEEEFLRLHGLFISEKLMEKNAELEKESVQHRQAEEELMQLREKERLRPSLAVETGVPASPSALQGFLSSLEIADTVYVPLLRIEELCGSLIGAPALSSKESGALVDQMCASMRKLRNLVGEMGKNLFLPRSAVLAPIRRVQIMIDVLKKDHRLQAGIAAVLAETEVQVRLFAAYMEDLLKLANIAKQALREEQVSLSALAGDITSRLLQSSPHRRAEIAIEPAMTVLGDGMLLRLALEQLLENAWQCTVEREETRITFSRKDGEGRIFVIADNGIGFSAHQVNEVFKVFGKVRPSPGNGIGMAIVKLVMSRHGGDIWGEGEPDKGARFYFRF